MELKLVSFLNVNTNFKYLIFLELGNYKLFTIFIVPSEYKCDEQTVISTSFSEKYFTRIQVILNMIGKYLKTIAHLNFILKQMFTEKTVSVRVPYLKNPLLSCYNPDILDMNYISFGGAIHSDGEYYFDCPK